MYPVDLVRFVLDSFTRFLNARLINTEECSESFLVELHQGGEGRA